MDRRQVSVSRTGLNSRWRRRIVAAVCVGAMIAGGHEARAFNFGEHHDIAVAAVRSLAPDARERLLRMHESLGDRKCPTGDLGPATERKNLACVSVADLGALAGDHACSAPDLEGVVARQDWTLRVIERAMRVRRDLQRSDGKVTFNDLWRASDLDLDLIDAAYGSRAASNDAHFALPRASDSLALYLYESLEVEQPVLNAVGLYAMFHAVALRFAVEASGTSAPDARRRLLQRGLLVESFAVHFLEDMFSAGHIVGTVGDIPTKKGTHDLYSEIGLDVRTWRGASYGAHGDAHMESADLEHASQSISKAYAQFLRAASGEPDLASAVQGMPMAAAERMYGFDVCRETTMPKEKVVGGALWPYLEDVLGDSPVPARATTLLPRGRAEVGIFLGVGSGVRGIVNSAPPLAANHGGAGGGELEFVGRAGVSLSDVVGPRSDGRVAVEAGRVFGADVSTRADGTENAPTLRRAYKFGIHLPFLVVPGDLLLLGPTLAFTSPKTLEAIAITSANGGLIPWQRPLLTRVGEVQFLLGRKIDVYLYDRRPVFIDGSSGQVASLRSIAVTSPVVEWRPMRTFSFGTSLGFSLRLSAGVEVPFGIEETTPGTTRFRSAFSGALGFEFWGRRFL